MTGSVTEEQRGEGGSTEFVLSSPLARRREKRGLRRRRIGRRAAVVLAVVAVPTVAAQGEWSQFGEAIGLGEERIALEPMPFEIAGASFPGSAFYYLDDLPTAASDVLSAPGAGAEGRETLTFAESHRPGVGAAAQAFRQAGDGLDKARALQCLAQAVYYEAASESYAGQQAVAQVVLNRVAHPAYPATVCGVVYQGSERRTGCQFTFTCDGSLARQPSRRGWALAQSVALGALAGEVYKPVGLATHYHTDYVNPYWAASLDYVGAIGAHRFYRWKGSAGQAGAFTDAYSGAEPLAAPGARRIGTAAPPSFADAVPPSNAAIGAAAEVGGPVGSATHSASFPAGAGGAPAAGTPASPDRLPAAGRVRKEYANSGRWLKEPGK